MIWIEGLSYRFRGSEQCALRDLSLEVEPGEFLVVTGPSGCGKSTLALAIGGYLFRQFDGEAGGNISVAGMDVRQQPIYDVAEVVGLVQQNPEAQFCTLTVRDEVAFGLENRCLPSTDIYERMAWALGIVGAEHLAERALATLSGGEKQKVAIAAMMAAKPQVLIFDEPTSNLDPTATADIFQVIEHIRTIAGITVIVIEHKTEYLRSFDPRLIEIQDGTIVYDGPVCTSRPSYHVNPDAQYPISNTQCPIPNTPLICIENLHAGFNSQPVLRDISLEVRSGEFVSVMGDNGSGKTTFLHCLLGLHKPSQGRVEVMGHDTRRTPVSELARQVGFVFQNPDHQLFADSVWEEATLAARNFGALDETIEAHAGGLLTRCGLGGRLDDHPYRLSYGQKRRLNLISVLGYAPRLLLVDEILIGQDPDNAVFLLDLLQQQVEEGGAVILVNHAPHITRRYASRILFFADGQLAVDAPTSQAFEQLQAMGWVAYVP
jgi:energy-coupling factor transporter ATP-binding protein EcfA2